MAVLLENGIKTGLIIDDGSSRDVNNLDIDEKIQVMINKTNNEVRKSCMFYPDEQVKGFWDIGTTM